MNPDFVRITFVPATDERGNEEVLACIGEVQVAQQAIKQAGGTELMPTPQAHAGMAFDSWDAFFKYLIPTTQAVGPILGAALGAWVAGRLGRKVRLKVGDIEVEGKNMQEIDALLKRVEALQVKQQEL